MAFINKLFASKKPAVASEASSLFKKNIIVNNPVKANETQEKAENNKAVDTAKVEVAESVKIKTVEEHKQEVVEKEEVKVKTEEKNESCSKDTSKSEEEETKEAKEEKQEEILEATEKVESEAPVKQRRKRTTKVTAEKQEDTEEEIFKITNVKYEPEKISLASLRKVFTCVFEDPEWENIKADLQMRAENIRIAEDINIGSIRILLAQTTNLYSDLRRQQRANKAFYNRLSDKVYGLIPRQKTANNIGKNAEERNRNSNQSCEQFSLTGKKGSTYNLFDIACVLEDRITIIDSLIDDVKQKKETLVAYLAVLKLENGMK